MHQSLARVAVEVPWVRRVMNTLPARPRPEGITTQRVQTPVKLRAVPAMALWREDESEG